MAAPLTLIECECVTFTPREVGALIDTIAHVQGRRPDGTIGCPRWRPGRRRVLVSAYAKLLRMQVAQME